MLTRSNGKRTSKQSATSVSESIKSFIRKTFFASPDFPRLYADVVISSAPNSNEARILRENYQKIVGMNMPVHPNVKSCMHIKVSGVRCGSPALRGEQFCYFHQRMVRGVKTPPQSRLHPIALIEDEEALQASIMEVINALARNTIDLRRAELILRALHIAVKNVHRVRFGLRTASMIKEVPDYPAAPKNDPVKNEAKNEPKVSTAPKVSAAPAPAAAPVASSPAVPQAPVRTVPAPHPPVRSAPAPQIKANLKKPPVGVVKPPVKTAARTASRGS
jgi:hypothetical protein